VAIRDGEREGEREREMERETDGPCVKRTYKKRKMGDHKRYEEVRRIDSQEGGGAGGGGGASM